MKRALRKKTRVLTLGGQHRRGSGRAGRKGRFSIQGGRNEVLGSVSQFREKNGALSEKKKSRKDGLGKGDNVSKGEKNLGITQETVSPRLRAHRESLAGTRIVTHESRFFPHW